MTMKIASQKSYCRQCGGERQHGELASEAHTWTDEEAPIDGGDVWSILKCLGCENVTFVHEHWFSEDYEIKEGGLQPILYREIYSPAPQRKTPEWGMDLFLNLEAGDIWIVDLHKQIYLAMGLKSNSLAAMGARAIVDLVVTSKAGQAVDGHNDFKSKLRRMHKSGLISEMLVDVIYAAFDAGSAAAHRGYIPTVRDLSILLDITENLLEIIYINPARQTRQAQDATELEARTPRRGK